MGCGEAKTQESVNESSARESHGIVMNVHEAIAAAEATLPGKSAPGEEHDPRWQAIMEIGSFIDSERETVWAFTEKWACHEDDDLQAAIATCLLEHILDAHFDAVIDRVETSARANHNFADTLSMCYWMGEAKKIENARRLNRLVQETTETSRDLDWMSG